MHFGDRFGVEDGGIALVAIAVFLGHLWPVFFRFVGGKGVATALGVLLGLNVWLGLATLVTWLVVAYAFRYSSLAALVAAIFAPFYYGLLFGADEILFAVIVMSALLLYPPQQEHRQPHRRQRVAHRQQERRRQASSQEKVSTQLQKIKPGSDSDLATPKSESDPGLSFIKR